ncbi:hypothetical protein HaLaN_15409, partial [Haematococcus lacustris]
MGYLLLLLAGLFHCVALTHVIRLNYQHHKHEQRQHHEKQRHHDQLAYHHHTNITTQGNLSSNNIHVATALLPCGYCSVSMWLLLCCHVATAQYLLLGMWLDAGLMLLAGCWDMAIDQAWHGCSVLPCHELYMGWGRGKCINKPGGGGGIGGGGEEVPIRPAAKGRAREVGRSGWAL